MDKPTLKEFIRYRSGRYVMTEDGRYYTIKNHKMLFLIETLIMIIFTIFVFLPLIFDFAWGINIAKDALVLVYIIVYLCRYWFFYRFARFLPVEQDSAEYQEVIDKPIKKHLWIVNIILALLLVFIYSTSSYSLAYLRSVNDTPAAECRIESAEMEKWVTVSTEDDNGSIRLNERPGEAVKILLFLSRTPKTPQLLLDGESVEADGIDRSQSFWFESDYFRQTGYYSIDAEDIRDGSVLTLFLGERQYEWTFSIP